MGDAELVRAAGGVLWRTRRREGADEGIEVLLVHRPRYDDWSFPKGKLDPDETFEDGARREVYEETGFSVTFQRELATSEYRDRYGRPKIVRYWSMTICHADPFTPNHEVDELCWLPPDEAARRLTYDADRAVLDAFERDRQQQSQTQD